MGRREWWVGDSKIRAAASRSRGALHKGKVGEKGASPTYVGWAPNPAPVLSVQGTRLSTSWKSGDTHAIHSLIYALVTPHQGQLKRGWPLMLLEQGHLNQPIELPIQDRQEVPFVAH